MPSETFIFSSNPDNGAVNRSEDGSQFSVQFVNPLYLPSNARNAKIEIIQANIWNVSPNISEALGNNMMTIQDDSGKHTVYLADGLYDIDTVYDGLALMFDNIPDHRPLFPFKDYFLFGGQDSTNRMYIQFKSSGAEGNAEILWNESSITEMLGFLPTSPTKPSTESKTDHEHSIFSPHAPKFNAYNSFVIHSDLVSEGIQLNNSFDNIIGQIQITTDTGTIETFRAIAPNPFALCNNLIGTQNARYRATFRLTSETGQPLDTMGEYWDITLLISWLEQEN